MTILFDLDGTLIDSTEAILESFRHAYAVSGGRTAPPDASIKSLIGYPLDVMFLELGIEAAGVQGYVDAYKMHYRAISKEKTELLPRAREAIEAASAFARLGIVTTKTARYSRELLEHFEVMDAFELLIGREDVVHPKPHPEPVLKAMAHFKCDPGQCWLVGDTRLDAGSAKAAGIRCVGVLSGYDNKAQLKTLTEFIENDAFEAVRFLAGKGINATF